MDSGGNAATALCRESDLEGMVQHVLSNLEQAEELQRAIVARLCNILQPVMDEVSLPMKELFRFRQQYPAIIQNLQRSSEIFKQILKWLDGQTEGSGASNPVKKKHKAFLKTANQCNEHSNVLIESNLSSDSIECTVSDYCETWDDNVVICKTISSKDKYDICPQSYVENSDANYGERGFATGSSSREMVFNDENGSMEFQSISGLESCKRNAVQHDSSDRYTSEIVKHQSIESNIDSSVTSECFDNAAASMEKLHLDRPGVLWEERSLLSNTQHRAEIQPLFLKDGFEMEVTVCYLVNPSFFYIQPCASQLHQMMEAFNWEIQQNEHLGGGIYPCVGLYVLAKYSEDDYWYRARIMNVTDMHNVSVLDIHPLNLEQLMVHVLFVDYGNRDRLPVSRIRHLKSEFCQLPQQSIRVSLAYVSPVEEVMWTKSQITWFAEQVKNKTFHALLHLSEGRTSVELYNAPKVNGKYKHGTSISDVMLCDGMASRNGLHGSSGLPQCHPTRTKVSHTFIKYLNHLQQSSRNSFMKEKCRRTIFSEKDEGQVPAGIPCQNDLEVEIKAKHLLTACKDEDRNNHYMPVSDPDATKAVRKSHNLADSEPLTGNKPGGSSEVPNIKRGHHFNAERQASQDNADVANCYNFPGFNGNFKCVESTRPAPVGLDSEFSFKVPCSPRDSHLERGVADEHELAQDRKSTAKEFGLQSSESCMQVQQQSSGRVVTMDIHKSSIDGICQGGQHQAESATDTSPRSLSNPKRMDSEDTTRLSEDIDDKVAVELDQFLKQYTGGKEPSAAARAGRDTSVYPEVELVSPSQEYFLCALICVVSPREFYVHIKNGWASGMEQMFKDLQQTYSTSTENLELGGATEDLIGKSCCVCISPGQCWFRGLVTMINLQNEYSPEQVQVLLVDVGQADWFSRFEVKILLPKFEKYPAFAQRCSMFNIQPTEQNDSGRKWSQEALYHFVQLTSNKKSFMGKICNRNASTGLDVVLLERSETQFINVNELMVFSGYATYIVPPTTGNSSNSLETWSNTSFSRGLSKYNTCNSHRNLGEVRSKGATLDKKPTEGIQKVPDKSGTVMKHRRSVSPHTSHSGAERSMEGLSKTVTESERALVSHFNTEGAVQAGDEHAGDADDCRALDIWDPRAQDFLSKRNSYAVSPDDPGVAMTSHAASSSRELCRMWQRGVCPFGVTCRFLHCSPMARDALMEGTVKVYCKPFNVQLPQEGSVVSLCITNIQDLCHFWACLTPEKVSHNTTMVTNEHSKGAVDAVVTHQYDLDTYKEMIADLQEHYSKYSFHEATTTLPALGELVVVRLNSNNQFYRARMCELHPAPFQVKVFLVDKGRMECVLESQVHAMKPEFLHVPFQALECNLHGVALTHEGTSDIAKSIFREMVLDRVLVARVESVSPLHVVFVTANVERDGRKQELNCWLVQQGWCQKVSWASERQVAMTSPRATLDYQWLPG
ncbi:uncharacterized protein LOC116938743 isoform X1 [Petromyzon marinus]|uniref:uncharacterized protein LOC116938743 isoform X1 n=1 Tax=Petromyzon marinus TaxID=7757 RepID=UPI003F725CEA